MDRGRPGPVCGVVGRARPLESGNVAVTAPNGCCLDGHWLASADFEGGKAGAVAVLVRIHSTLVVKGR
jgi:hypothetical protein